MRKQASLVNDLRAGDYDRFLVIQLAPPERRAGLTALAMFHVELARIAELVSEPLMGHMRLAWWREALEEIAEGKAPRNHPVVLALAELLPAHPLLMPLMHETIEARAADLDTSLLAQEADWRRYCTRTAGNLHLAMAHVLDSAAATTHASSIQAAGMAYAMLGLARAIAFMESQGWLRLPHARLNAHGLTRLTPEQNLAPMVQRLVEDACEALPQHTLPRSFLPLGALERLAGYHAKRLRRVRYNPYRLRPSRLGAVVCVTRHALCA